MTESSATGPALRAVLCLWAAEAALARLTSDAQAPLDMVLALVLLLGIGLLPLLIAQRLAPRSAKLRALACGFAGALPLCFVAAGILYAPAAHFRPKFGPISVVLLTGALIAWRMLASVRYARPISRPASIAMVLGVVTLSAWRFLGDGFPSLGMMGSVLGAYAVCAALASRPRWALALLLLAPGLGLWPSASRAPQWREGLASAAAHAPDIVMLCVDTLRADAARDMQTYQLLAQQGVEFTRTQASGPWTLPSMSSVMTGLAPWSHGAGSGPAWAYVGLPSEVPVLAELMREGGYDTAALVHNPVVSEDFGFARGFTSWDSATARTAWSLPRTRSTMEARPFAAHLAAAAQLWGRRDFFNADDLARGGLAIWEARRADHPLFLWMHFLDCHFPYRRASEVGEVSWARRMTLERGDAHLFRADPWWAEAEGRAALGSAYRAEIAAVDRAILGFLEALGPPTDRGRIVVLFSDHGEEFFEHGGIEHGHALWQELLAVPLVIVGLPGRAAGSVEEEVVGHSDLAPTLLAAAGIPLPQPEDAASRLIGRDLAQFPLAPMPLVSENLLRSLQPWDSEWAVRIGDLKAIFGPTGNAVFDLSADPAERQNRAVEFAEFLQGILARPARIPRTGAGSGAAAQRAMQRIGYVGF